MRRPVPDTPGPGQESVWDYPRPPRIERTAAHVAIVLGGRTILDTTDVVRVLETSHPPVYYVPVADFVDGALAPVAGTTFCEFKGAARYYDVRGGADAVAARGAWGYPDPAMGEELLRDRVAVYARPMDAVTLDGAEVRPQDGDFYGGWITDRVTGPFKGAPGTLGW